MKVISVRGVEKHKEVQLWKKAFGFYESKIVWNIISNSSLKRILWKILFTKTRYNWTIRVPHIFWASPQGNTNGTPDPLMQKCSFQQLNTVTQQDSVCNVSYTHRCKKWNKTRSVLFHMSILKIGRINFEVSGSIPRLISC